MTRTIALVASQTPTLQQPVSFAQGAPTALAFALDVPASVAQWYGALFTAYGPAGKVILTAAAGPTNAALGRWSAALNPVSTAPLQGLPLTGTWDFRAKVSGVEKVLASGPLYVFGASPPGALALLGLIGIALGATTPPTLAGDADDYEPGPGPFQRWSASAAVRVTGMAQGNFDGETREIWNVGAWPIALPHQDAGSVPSGRWTTATGQDLTLPAGRLAVARCDFASQTWRVYVAGAGGASAVAASLAVTADNAAPAAGTPFHVTVTARDANGDVAPSYGGTVALTSSDGQALLPGNAKLTSGVGMFTVTLKTAGAQSVTATDTAVASINGFVTENVGVAAAGRLAFVTQPQFAPAATNAPLSQGPAAAVQDAYGNTVTSDNATQITLALTTPGGATLSGVTTRTVSAGVATFPGLSVDTAGTYTFTATSSPAYTAAVSAPFTVTAAAAANHYVVTVSNAAPAAGAAVTVTVTAKDANGATVTGYAGTVHLTSTDGQAVLAADNTLASGVGAFSCTLKTAGAQSVTATDTVSSGINGAVTITPSPAAANKLAFGQQPTGANVNAAITPSPTVVIQDQYGNARTADTTSLTVALTSAGGATLGGTLTRAAVAGVATFPGLTVNLAGSYSLTATGSGLTSAASGSFAVSGGVLSGFTQLARMPNDDWGEGLVVKKSAAGDYYLFGTTQQVPAGLIPLPSNNTKFVFRGFAAKVNAQGVLQTAWGDMGYCYLFWGDGLTAFVDDEITDAVIDDANNRIYVASTRLDHNSGLFRASVAKLVLSTGFLDGAFGTNGEFTTSLAGQLDSAPFYNQVRMAVQQSGGNAGKIILLTDGVVGVHSAFVFGRVLANGSGLDTSFGANGIRKSNYLNAEDAYAAFAAVDAADKILVAGRTTTGGGSASGWYVERYNADGTPDGTVNGSAPVGQSGCGVLVTFPASDAGSSFLVNLVAVGSSKWVGVGQSKAGATQAQHSLVRLNADLGIDLTYGASGHCDFDSHSLPGFQTLAAPSWGVNAGSDKIRTYGVTVGNVPDGFFSDGGYVVVAQFLANGSGLDTAGFNAPKGYLIPSLGTNSEVCYFGADLAGAGHVCTQPAAVPAVPTANPNVAVACLVWVNADGTLNTNAGDPANPSYPAAPAVTSVSAAPNSTGAVITLNVSGADRWHVNYGLTPELGTLTADRTTNGNGLTATISGLSNGQTVYYRVSAVKANGTLFTPTFTPTASFNTATTLRSNFTAYWTGADLLDSTGNARTLTNNNGVTFTNGGPAQGGGRAATFAGAPAQQSLSRASEAAFQTDSAHDWTWPGWVTFNDTGGNPAVAGKFDNATNCEWVLWYHSAAGLRADIYTANGSGQSTAEAGGYVPAPGVPQFVVVQYDATLNKLLLWINGSLAATATGVVAITAGSAPYREGNVPGLGYLNGQVAERGWCKSAPGAGGLLTPAQIATLYNAGNGLTWATMP